MSSTEAFTATGAFRSDRDFETTSRWLKEVEPKPGELAASPDGTQAAVA